MSILLDRGSAEHKNTAVNRWEQSLLRVAVLPSGVTAVLSVVAVLATLLSAGSSLTGVFGAIGSVWLAVHQIPVYIGGTDLGALPLLPTLLVFAGVARCAYRFAPAGASFARQGQILAAAVGGPLVFTVVALALVADASSALGVSGPGPLVSVAGVVAVHAAAAVVGMGLRVVRANAERWGLPQWMLVSLRGGAIAALSFFAVGALLTVVGAFVGWTDIAEMIGTEGSVVGQLGLLLLSIMYLPNVMVAGSAVLSGATGQIGAASYSLFDVVPGPVPAVPVLGTLPQSELGGYWPLLLAVSAGIGLWLGWRYRSIAGTRLDTVRFFVASGAVAAMICLALGFLASGEMGSFGYLGVDPAVFAIYVFGWVTVPGLAVSLAGLAMDWRRGREAGGHDDAYEPDDGYGAYDDYSDEYIDEYVEAPAELAQAAEPVADAAEEDPVVES